MTGTAPADEFADTVEPDYTGAADWIVRDDVRGRSLDPLVFYVHPTTAPGPFWFAGSEDDGVRASTTQVVGAQTVAFPGRLWAPRYRQATTRAFFERDGDGRSAYELAYRDVSAAFAAFLKQDAAHDGSPRPIVLAGHSQGARHVLSILGEYFAGSAALAARLVAAYAIGIPIPADHPVLTAFPVPADDHSPGVLIGWTSVLAGNDVAHTEAGDSASVCVNPLTFAAPHRSGTADAHILADSPRNDLDRVRVSAHCRNGVLAVEPAEPGALDSVVLAGGNLHRVDVELFTGNIRADVRRRTATWRRRREPAATAEKGMQ